MSHLIYFSSIRNNFVNRPRHVPGNPSDDNHAIQLSLAALRPGALRRYAMRHTSLNAHVARPGDPTHPNGTPALLHTYRLNLTAV